MNEEKHPSVYPEEMPSGENKKYDHGVIVDVVKNEIEPTPSTNPAQPHETDAINTEFAKQMSDFN